MHIFLIGFMGSGKSYVGRRLAEAIGRPFVDLDQRIEAEEGQSISEIFAQKGEWSFRNLEAKHLRKCKKMTNAVIACGGGTPVYRGNMDWINHHGLSIFLDVPPATLLSRLQSETAQRPLLAGQEKLEDYLHKKLAERRPTYEKAHIRLVLGNPKADVVRLILDHLQFYRPELK